MEKEEKQGELVSRPGRKPKYKREYCDRLLEMAIEGRSINSFCARFSISKTTFYDWKKKYKDFDYAADLAEVNHDVFWEEKFKKAITGEIQVNDKLMLKMMDLMNLRHKPEQPKDNTAININNFNLPSSELSPEERQQRIQDLISKANDATKVLNTAQQNFTFLSDKNDI